MIRKRSTGISSRLGVIALTFTFALTANAFRVVGGRPAYEASFLSQVKKVQPSSTPRCPRSASTCTTRRYGRHPISFALALSPAEAWSSYNDALEASPLLVKSVTASVILGAADLAGQAIEKVRKEGEADERSTTSNCDNSVDWARAVRFAIFGLVLQA